MPVRIYALAKELKFDSKELVDICTKAGITGKGSALASLTDDEIVKVKAFISSKPSPGSSSGSTAGKSSRPSAITKDEYVSGGNTGVRPKHIRSVTKTVPAATTNVIESETEIVAEQPVGDVDDTQEAVVAEQQPDSESQAPIDITGERDEPNAPEQSKRDPMAPTREPFRPGVLKPRLLSSLKSKPKSGESKGPTKSKEPIVRVAAIPKTTSKVRKPKSEEPAPQKPIMTLPADAIRNAKSGKSAPLEQFTKQNDRSRGSGGKGDTAADKSDAGSRGRRRGKVVVPAEESEDKKLSALSNARAARQQKRRRNLAAPREDEEGDQRRKRRRLVRKGTNTAAPRKGKVVVELPCTVRTLSEGAGVPTVEIQRALMALGTMVTINAELDAEMAELVASELEMDVEFKEPETLEDKLITQIDEVEDDPESLQTRPPVITFLGHVDHGKTSLLDSIIGIDVVSGEAGGITQHIRAYKIDKDGREIAFVDTPGHEAFTEMRARGANVTDIAVLVIAADDGVMPQTEEAISHARAANVPIVVALNKIDLPGADVNQAYQGLAQHELLPTEWGGEVDVVKTSAITGEGMDDLLETLLLTADIHEYKANPNRSAVGVCLEAEQKGNRGVVAKVIVKNGTLRVGDIVVCGGGHGRVKAMTDTLHPKLRIEEAGPSTPVSLIGLDIAPEAGDSLYVLDDIADARQIAESRQTQSRSRSLSGKTVRVSFEEFQKRMEEGRLAHSEEASVLNIILRADVRGSIEAIQKELAKLAHPEVKVNLMQASVGGVTSADVTLADASNAVIVGFNVIPDESARHLAEDRGVEIRRYDIIYKVTEDIKALLEGRLKPEERVKDLGRALVQQTFTISRLGTVAGCRVLGGTIERGCRIRVNRDGRGIGDYGLDSLKREKEDTKEVREGYECGMKLSGFNDLKEGDILEAYKVEEIARTL